MKVKFFNLNITLFFLQLLILSQHVVQASFLKTTTLKNVKNVKNLKNVKNVNFNESENEFVLPPPRPPTRIPIQSHINNVNQSVDFKNMMNITNSISQILDAVLKEHIKSIVKEKFNFVKNSSSSAFNILSNKDQESDENELKYEGWETPEGLPVVLSFFNRSDFITYKEGYAIVNPKVNYNNHKSFTTLDNKDKQNNIVSLFDTSIKDTEVSEKPVDIVAMGFPKDWKKIFTQIEEDECDGGEYEYEYSFEYGDDSVDDVDEESDGDEEDEDLVTPSPVTKIKKIKYRIEKDMDMNPVAQEGDDCDDEKEHGDETSINDKFPFAARKFILIGVKKSSVDKRDEQVEFQEASQGTQKEENFEIDRKNLDPCLLDEIQSLATVEMSGILEKIKNKFIDCGDEEEEEKLFDTDHFLFIGIASNDTLPNNETTNSTIDQSISETALPLSLAETPVEEHEMSETTITTSENVVTTTVIVYTTVSTVFIKRIPGELTSSILPTEVFPSLPTPEITSTVSISTLEPAETLLARSSSNANESTTIIFYQSITDTITSSFPGMSTDYESRVYDNGVYSSFYSGYSIESDYNKWENHTIYVITRTITMPLSKFYSLKSKLSEASKTRYTLPKSTTAATTLNSTWASSIETVTTGTLTTIYAEEILQSYTVTNTSYSRISEEIPSESIPEYVPTITSTITSTDYTISDLNANNSTQTSNEWSSTNKPQSNVGQRATKTVPGSDLGRYWDNNNDNQDYDNDLDSSYYEGVDNDDSNDLFANSGNKVQNIARVNESISILAALAIINFCIFLF
ncbi:hypothetical protein BVG19_g2969 [[Candida] boidinii]|nr:hypothetical protein BVG19_g2969 [[Candida] boidinii]OWB50432.1 hypothetical protein B5S27_g1982 [[Candida] boidinii]